MINASLIVVHGRTAAAVTGKQEMDHTGDIRLGQHFGAGNILRFREGPAARPFLAKQRTLTLTPSGFIGFRESHAMRAGIEQRRGVRTF